MKRCLESEEISRRVPALADQQKSPAEVARWTQYNRNSGRWTKLSLLGINDHNEADTITTEYRLERRHPLQSRRLPWTADDRQRVDCRRTVDMVVQPKDVLQGLSKIPTRHCQVSKQLRHVHQVVCDQMADIPLPLPLPIDRE